jgi:hypothetical protein
MTTAARTSSPTWQAEVVWESRHVRIEEEPPEDEPDAIPEFSTMKIWICFVDVSRQADEQLRFRVNHRAGRSLTVTDPRDRLAGTANTTGIWGTRPAPRASRPRPMSLIGFQVELARLIGAKPAEEIIRSIRADFFLEPSTTNVIE